MTELATLQIKVQADGAIRAVDNFAKAAENAGKKSEFFTDKQGRLRHESGRYASAAEKAAISTGQLGASLNRTARQTEAATSRTAALSTAMGVLGGVIGAQVISRASQMVGDLINTADTMRLLEGRIRLVTDSQEGLVETTALLRQLAIDTRSPFEDTVKLYSRFALATEETGIEQGKLLKFTELLNLAVQNSGATAAEANAALFQLSQGLAAGALRGEEFNSVIEQTPAIARAIAEGMGIPLSQLRKFANEGKLTTDLVLSGVLRMEQEIRGDFENAPLTVAKGWQTLKDAVSQTIGEIDKATSASSLFARALAGTGRFISGAVALPNNFAAGLGNFVAAGRGAGMTTPARGPSSAAPLVITATAGATDDERAAAAAALKRMQEFEALLARLEFSALVGDVLRLAAATRAEAMTRINAQARQSQLTGEFNALIGETGNEVIRFTAGAADGTDALTESARVFAEQSQLALSRFASDFLKDGFKSLDNFWQSFQQLGRDALGNIFAREFMDRIGNQISDAISGSGIGGLASLGIGGALISGFLNQRQESQRIAEAMEESARSIALFARKAGDADLTAEQRALRDILDERDQKARTAVSAAGFGRRFSGGFDETIAEVRRLMSSGGGMTATIFGPLYEQLLALQEASEANAEAVRESIAALEQEAALRRASTLEAFRDSLALSGASTLSPVQQLAEAQRQYDAILGLAQGGDQSAIDSLPETARTLLDAARSVFASGTRYADVFGKVNADVDDIINSLRNTPGGADPLNEDPLGFEPEEIAFAALIESNASIRTGVGEMQSAIVAEQQAQITVLQGGFTSMVTQLQAAVARLDSIDRSVRETNSLRTPDTTTLVY